MKYRCSNCKKTFSSDTDDVICPHCDSSDVAIVDELEIYPGQTVDGYLIGEKIGEGAISEVFHATNLADNSEVVVKFPKNLFKNDKRYRQRFLQEALILRSIKHENVLRLIKTIENSGFRNSANSGFRDSAINGNIILVTELIDGIDLNKMLHLEGSLPLEQAVDYLLQACMGLEQAHLKGIIHRDIKPDNFLVSSKNVLKVADFGLAKIRNPQLPPGAEHISGTFKGTPAYSAPEQIRGEKPSIKSDIYSFGITAYQLCTGRLPFETGTVEAILYEHLNNEIKAPRLVNPTSPKDLESLIIEMTEKEPDNRPESMNEIHDRLFKINQNLGNRNPEVVENLPAKRLNPLYTFTAMLLILIAVALYFTQKHFVENERKNASTNNNPDEKIDFKSMLQNMSDLTVSGNLKILTAQNGNIYAYSADKIYKLPELKTSEPTFLTEKQLQLIAQLSANSNDTSLFDCENLLIHQSVRFVIMQYPEKLDIAEIQDQKIHHKLTLPKAYYSGFILDDAEQKLFIAHEKYCNIVTFSDEIINLEKISHPACDAEIIDVNGVCNNFTFLFTYSIKDDIFSEILNLQRDEQNYNLESVFEFPKNSFSDARILIDNKDLYRLLVMQEYKYKMLKTADYSSNVPFKSEIFSAFEGNLIAYSFTNSGNTLIILTKSETAKTQLTLQILDFTDKKPTNILQINVPNAVAINDSGIFLFQKRKMLIVVVNFTDSSNVVQNKIFKFTEAAK
ncbi:MAG: protein kinase [Planctomycetes bacterium]|nr:protein kinase [Planctomycetota bacterium]